MAISDRGVFELFDEGDGIFECDDFIVELREYAIAETAWGVVVTELALHGHEELVEAFPEELGIKFHPEHRGILLDGVFDLTVEVVERLQLLVLDVDCDQLGEIRDIQVE